MIDSGHDLSIMRQAQLLDPSRSVVYYRPQPTAAADLALMRRIHELHLEHSFAGARMLRDLLRQDGYAVGRKHVATLMRVMGIEALHRKANTSRRYPEHRTYPYLLRGLTIDRPNQVWAMDITYLPMARGFVYLAVALDWATHRILAWRLSNTLTADFCVEALEEAITRYGTPDIMNTDQGSQFTGSEFIGVLERHQIAISMDGKGCWRDNVFVERLCTPPGPRRRRSSPRTSTSTTAEDRTLHSTGKRPTRHNSTDCRSPRRPEPQSHHLRNPKNCPTARDHLY
jgi:putative transposase